MTDQPTDDLVTELLKLAEVMTPALMWAHNADIVIEAAARIAELEARNRLMTELLNDVLGIAPDWEQEQVWALNLSRSSSVGLPEKFRALWQGSR